MNNVVRFCQKNNNMDYKIAVCDALKEFNTIIANQSFILKAGTIENSINRLKKLYTKISCIEKKKGKGPFYSKFFNPFSYSLTTKREKLSLTKTNIAEELKSDKENIHANNLSVPHIEELNTSKRIILPSLKNAKIVSIDQYRRSNVKSVDINKKEKMKTINTEEKCKKNFFNTIRYRQLKKRQRY